MKFPALDSVNQCDPRRLSGPQTDERGQAGRGRLGAASGRAGSVVAVFGGDRIVALLLRVAAVATALLVRAQLAGRIARRRAARGIVLLGVVAHGIAPSLVGCRVNGQGRACIRRAGQPAAGSGAGQGWIAPGSGRSPLGRKRAI